MVRLLFGARVWLDRLNRLAATLSACAVAFACLAITWAVAGRGLAGMNTIWENEASVYLLIYAAFLSAAYTDRAGSQIAVDMLRPHLGGRALRAQRLILDLLAMGLFALLAVSGAEMFLAVWKSGWRSESLWGPPLWIPYLAIPLGAALMVPNLAVDILLRLAGQDVPRDHAKGDH